MIRRQFIGQALGSVVQLTVVVTDELKASEILDTLWRDITIFESMFSRFQSDSELTYVNQHAGSKTAISPEFTDLITAAHSLAQQTDGIYNPFILPELQTAGYKGSWPNPTQFDPETDFSARIIVDPSAIEIGSQWLRIPASAALDFGGIGKGYLLDQLADQLEEQGVESYWLSLGGDIICRGEDELGIGWDVGIQSAETESIFARVSSDSQNRRRAIATSGTTKRHGTNWHHIIDPRTGRPADTDILTATIVTERAVEADVYAKCAVILGSRGAPEFLAMHHIDDYVLQRSAKAGILRPISTGEITLV